LFPRDVEIHSPVRVGGDARAVRPGPRTSQSQTPRARWRLVMRGGDLSCEAETCRARRRRVPLVGNWSKMQPTG
jgi:hypothetical protein